MFIARRLSSLRRTFTRDERGLALIEFAFVMPLLVLVFYGGLEVTRYILMNQKLDNASHTVADLINQNLNIDGPTLTAVVDALGEMVKPYDAADVGVIVTNIRVPAPENPGDPAKEPETFWQCSYGNVRGGSKIAGGGEGGAVSLPDLELLEKEQVMVVEVYLDYKPILDNDAIRELLGLNETQGIYKRSLARPRFGTFEFAPSCS